jgi:hypothetical protein
VQILGIREDPYAFFLDMFKLALGLQLGSAALVFYGSELGLGLDAGDAFRAVGGLALGYFLRLGIKIEQLVSIFLLSRCDCLGERGVCGLSGLHQCRCVCWLWGMEPLGFSLVGFYSLQDEVVYHGAGLLWR